MIDISTGSININDIVLSTKLTVDDFKNSTLYMRWEKKRFRNAGFKIE